MSQTDEPDTDTKLAILQSIFEDASQTTLLNNLLDHDGDVDEVIATLSTKRVKLDARRRSSGHASSQISPLTRLRWSEPIAGPRRKAEPLLQLYTASQIEAVVPCTLILNVLPSNLATTLLETMLGESSNWTQGYFKLFDRTVTSPHVAGFYLKSEEDIKAHREYVYNGQVIQNIRTFTSEMAEAHAIVEKQTQDWLESSGHLKHALAGEVWRANVAFSNLYDGRESAVGYHSDQLTYLGPMPTIASLSLGCEREFRLKPVNAGRTISIRLPHNSLFIMGPGCQEDFKHSIHPVSFRMGIDMHPVAGPRRINITYRNYRADYLPSMLPRCTCGQTVLRSTKDDKSQESFNTGSSAKKVPLFHGHRYFWHCDGDKRPDGKGCGFFKWADFEPDGAPIL